MVLLSEWLRLMIVFAEPMLIVLSGGVESIIEAVEKKSNENLQQQYTGRVKDLLQEACSMKTKTHCDPSVSPDIS